MYNTCHEWYEIKAVRATFLEYTAEFITFVFANVVNLACLVNYNVQTHKTYLIGYFLVGYIYLADWESDHSIRLLNICNTTYILHDSILNIYRNVNLLVS